MKSEPTVELLGISPKKKSPHSTILDIEEESTKIPEVTLPEEHNVHFLDTEHHEIKFLLHSHEHVVDMYQNNVRVLKNVTSASKNFKLDLTVEGTPCRSSMPSTFSVKGEIGSEDQISQVIRMVHENHKSPSKKKKKRKKSRARRRKYVDTAADIIQAVNDVWGDGTFSSTTKTLRYFFSGTRVQLWAYVQITQWVVLVAFASLAFFERPLWCASDSDWNLYYGTYKKSYYMVDTPDVEPRLLRSFDLILLLLLCVLYVVRSDIVQHQW
jgi:hypothetical protein